MSETWGRGWRYQKTMLFCILQNSDKSKVKANLQHFVCVTRGWRKYPMSLSQAFGPKDSSKIFLKYPKYPISLEPEQDFQLRDTLLNHLFNCSTNTYHGNPKIIQKRSQTRIKDVWGPDGICELACCSSYRVPPGYLRHGEHQVPTLCLVHMMDMEVWGRHIPDPQKCMNKVGKIWDMYTWKS